MADDSFAAGLVGITLDGRYRLDALLGEGGMGAVYRAHHLAMDRKVAVKLLKPHLTGDDTALQRFAREARSTLKVESQHAVKVLDYGVTPQRDYYMVLEYLDGRTVQRELDIDGPFAPARVLHVAQHALHALGAAHRIGVIHRDIKPDNILLLRIGDDPDYAKLLDFGVAKLMEGAAVSDRSALALTQTGMVFGTPEFMSPEQACGQPLDARSDLYALAATMFAMLTGCGLFAAGSAIEWLTHHARTPPPHLADVMPELAAFGSLDALLQRALAKRRDDRPPNADQMARELAAIEASLGGGASRGSTTARNGMVRIAASPSSYIAALAPDAVAHDPDATLVPNAAPPIPAAAARADAPQLAPPAPPTGDHPTTTGELAALTASSRRRGRYLALGALAVIGMIAAVIVVATRSHRTTRAAGAPARDGGAGVALAAASSDASVAADPPSDARPIAAAVPRDAIAADAPRAIATAHPAGSGSSAAPAGSSSAATASEVALHVAAAAEAQRVANPIRQITEANAALRADPHNVRALLLLADALLSTGDLDRGCKYLHDLGHNAVARVRAHQAGCPGD